MICVARGIVSFVFNNLPIPALRLKRVIQNVCVRIGDIANGTGYGGDGAGATHLLNMGMRLDLPSFFLKIIVASWFLYQVASGGSKRGYGGSTHLHPHRPPPITPPPLLSSTAY